MIMNVRVLKFVILFLAALSVAYATDRVSIPAGSFLMWCSTGDTACDVDEGTAGGASVNVGEFKIDKHEVSVGEYRACIKAGKCNRQDHSRNKYCNYDAKGRDLHPVNCVDWQPAQNYCQYNSNY